MSTRSPNPTPPTPTGRRLALVLMAGALVVVALGTFGQVHEPTGRPLLTFGFSSMIGMKATFTSIVAVGAVAQLVLALRMYGRVGAGQAPGWVGPAHRSVGILTVLVSLPVAAHCLWALGLQSGDTRVLVHSLLGCLFYGAFVSKVLGLRLPGVPAAAIPWLGGSVFAIIVALWVTSSLWFYTTVEFPGF